jgi:hypothetical protein
MTMKSAIRWRLLYEEAARDRGDKQVIYTVQVTVKVTGHTEQYAYRVIKHALNASKFEEIILVDQEVVGTENEERDDEPELPLE